MWPFLNPFVRTGPKWMGHSKIETTAIYANALGEEQRQIAERMWQ
jgi:hypothetical protein